MKDKVWRLLCTILSICSPIFGSEQVQSGYKVSVSQQICMPVKRKVAGVEDYVSQAVFGNLGNSFGRDLLQDCQACSVWRRDGSLARTDPLVNNAVVSP
jgi:hypothetical protein